MEKHTTELVMILDRSGSMAGLEGDTVGGYNAMLKKQAGQKGEVLVSTVLFNERSRLLYDRVSLREMPLMTEQEYTACGCTALLDAVGGAVRHIGHLQRHALENERPEKTIFVIITDGLENASRTYTYGRVKQMIERKKAQYGWEFLFLGANIDAIGTAGRFGIQADRAADYISDHEGTELNYEVLAETVCEMRRAPSAIGAGWKKRLDEDYKRRQ